MQFYSFDYYPPLLRDFKRKNKFCRIIHGLTKCQIKGAVIAMPEVKNVDTVVIRIVGSEKLWVNL